MYCPVREKVSTTTALTFLDSGRTGAFISLDMIPVGAAMLMISETREFVGWDEKRCSSED